ncbi:MAG: N-6 DNA methylase [Bacteroidales bacterium]|nr:N-6 DNA methylase [Bacteroidales bacterium]
MSLFQKSVEKKYLNELDSALIDKKFKDFQNYFGNIEIQENIRNSKEEEFQEGFIRELFVNILNYTLKPNPEFNIVLEKKNVDDSKKADAAIIRTKAMEYAEKQTMEAAMEHAPSLAVIELKSTSTTDLDTVETQAFGYKNHNPECEYVITSNFEKLRFYIQNAVENIEFDLFNLTKEQFSLMWLCLSKDNLLKNLPLKIKESSVLKEEDVTKELYADYSKFRQEIFGNILKNNPDKDQLILFKKTQKLLDRFLFIFFAEDRLLLPPNSISEIVKQWTTLKEDLDAYVPLYDRFKKYFGYMNSGFKGKNYDIFPYNGGLFFPDEILDNIAIDDDILHEHTLKLSAYDFETDIDVNILGHIFEHSLAEIENVQAKLRGETIDKQKTKRKKDGIFYTPKYITKYIVENTVGKLCSEKRNELEIIDEEYAKGRKNRKKDTIKKLDQKLGTYRNWLLSLTILDPACGSGAFLNQALEFLINEHKKIDELRAQLLGAAIVFSDITIEILEKNIHGVDINEESVEIAKLSLWLRTAQKGRKLNTLSNNIKCGNSLIDNPEVAGEKAFNWQKEFPHVFEKKEKKAWHVTFATHNSRYSQRMFDNHVKLGEPVWLSEKEEQIVTEKIAEIVEEDKLNILAYNICGDHIHLLLICEEEELQDIVQKIKSISARACNIAMGRTIPISTKAVEHAIQAVEHAPQLAHSTKSRGTTQTHLWTRKFGKREITDNEDINNIITYIKNNRQKHELPEHTNDRTCSIVEKMTCTQEHAFRTEYKGGFDVVIGNPPYVQIQGMGEMSEKLEKQNFKTFEKTGDLYCLFYELGNIILKQDGLLGFITSNKWMRANYGKKLRKYFAEQTNPKILIDLGSGIFETATVDSNILIFEKSKITKHKLLSLDLTKEKVFTDFNNYINKSTIITELSEDVWTIANPIEQQIKKKIEKTGTFLKDWDVEIYRGIVSGLTDAFIIEKSKRDELIQQDPKNKEIIKTVLRGRDIKRYNIEYQNLYFINTHNGYGNFNKINIDEYPAIKKHLDQFEPQLSKRYDKGDTPYNLRNCTYVENFEKEKIIYPDINSQLSFVYDSNNFFLTNTSYFLNTNSKYILSVLNSSLIQNYYSHISAQLGNKGLRHFTIYIEKIPIPKISKESQQPFIEKADQMLDLNKQLQEKKSKFLNRVKDNLATTVATRGHVPLTIKISKKLDAFYETDFKTFVAELKKQKLTLSLIQQDAWEEYFTAYKTEINQLQYEISKTDKKIDQMVYELYGLTPEEIEIVENSVK